MKNLKLFFNLHYELPELDNAEYVCFCGKSSRTTEFISPDEQVFFFKDNSLWSVSLENGNKRIYSLTDVFGSEVKVSPLVSVMFNELNEEFYSFHSGGEVFSFRVNFSENTVTGQPLDTIDGGIVAVEWSSDDELGVIVNNKCELFVVTSTCDVVNYWDLQDEMEGEQKFINVGWGKKETQFQGSAGKAAAFAKPEALSPDETSDERSVKVTWRGDSSLFAVSYWCPKSLKRRIKIFNRDGVLQCNGEDIIGLEEPLSWRPQGNLLSMVQRLPNKYVIAFMEKNGLKHYDFTLPEDLKVLDLSWNHDSQILCTSCFDSNSKKYVHLFWVSSNYHWYLKQSYVCNSKTIALVWDSKRENRVKLALQDGSLHVLEFTWTMDHSGCSFSDDKSYISVIDNRRLLITQCSRAIIPPPMAMWTLEFTSRVRQVCYPQQTSSYSLAAVCEEEINFILKDSQKNLIISKTYKLDTLGIDPNNLFSWLWSHENNFACLEFHPGCKTGLVILEVCEDRLRILKKTVVDYPVVSLLASGSKLLLGRANGSYGEYIEENLDFCAHREVFPEMCLNPLGFKNQLIGLSEIGRLYINNVHVASNITSFLVTQPFLIATTSLHTLLVLKFTSENQCEEISRRKLENGSKLVLATSTFVVLQLPRGNLETIQPRALTLLSIGSLLDNQQYGEAVQTLRRNRILLDICVDHDPESFLKNVGTFVNQVDSQSLVILVSEMSSGDVTSTTYSMFYNQKRNSLDDKINKVCSAFVEELSKLDRAKEYTLAILSCLVKMKKMNEAIKLADSDQALQHLLFLVPVEKLYSHALEAYNLPAALKIAGKSQMDPKEYVPYLNNLREMDSDYMKFTIDKSLNKFSSALSHLARCGPDKEDECFAFINDHSLYKHGMSVFEKDDDRYKKCALMYGEFLFKKRCFEEAGCMFSRAGNHARAIEAFTASCHWPRALSIAKNNNFSEEAMTKLSGNLFEHLMASNLYREAALLSELHLCDYERAVEAYTLAYLWDEALLVTTLHNRQDLIDSKIKKRLLEYANNLILEMNTKNENISKYVDRLKVVRIEKLNRPKFQDFDDMSETSSVSTRTGTSHSYSWLDSHCRARAALVKMVVEIKKPNYNWRSSRSKSSKMTRKASRKLWSLKEGNPREEEALLSALREIYLSAEKCPVEVKKVCGALVYVGIDELAIQLQQSTKDWLHRLSRCMPTIWPKDPNDEPTAAIDAMIKCAPEIHLPSSWELESLAVNT